MLLRVGGEVQFVGKTEVASGLIRMLPRANWCAVKVQPHSHCIDPAICPFELVREWVPNSRTDSGRFLAAGARRSYCLHANGTMEPALPTLQELVQKSQNLLIECCTIPEALPADLYLYVVDTTRESWQEAAERTVRYVDAFVRIAHEAPAALPTTEHLGKPMFPVCSLTYTSAILTQFVKDYMQTEMVQ